MNHWLRKGLQLLTQLVLLDFLPSVMCICHVLPCWRGCKIHRYQCWSKFGSDQRCLVTNKHKIIVFSNKKRIYQRREDSPGWFNQSFVDLIVPAGRKEVPSKPSKEVPLEGAAPELVRHVRGLSEQLCSQGVLSRSDFGRCSLQAALRCCISQFIDAIQSLLGDALSDSSSVISRQQSGPAALL